METLRAWERRYGLLQPERSSGGFRLYSQHDEAIVRAMISEIDRGFPPAQAAKLALAWSETRNGHNGRHEGNGGPPAGRQPAAGTIPPADQSKIEETRDKLYRALVGFDGARAHDLLDELFAEFTLNAVLRDVLLPCLETVGTEWARGDLSVSQEHFSSQLIRDRLLSLARGWDQGRGPRALLSCPENERHDIGLICFGLVLSRHGWRITFLGADTPISALAEAAEALAPEMIVLTSNLEERFSAIAKPLRALSLGRELALGGPGATPTIARAVGATLLEDAPVGAAMKIGGRSPGPTG